MRIASRTGQTPDEAKLNTSYRQLMRWEVLFKEEDEKEIRESLRAQWYMARIAYEVALLQWTVASLVKSRGPFTRKIEDFLIKYEDEEGAKKKTKWQGHKQKLTDEEKVQYEQAVWLLAVGLDPSVMSQ